MPPVRQRIDEPEYSTPLAERIIQSEESRLMRSGRAGFDYEGISQRYPLADIRRATAPRYIQRELNEEDVMLNIRETELAKRQADLQIQDSLVNQTREMYRQIPQARSAIAQLDPASDDFLNQLISLQSENPLAYENSDFQSTVVNPLIRRHEDLQRNKMMLERSQKPPEEEKPITRDDYIKALVDRDALLGKKKLEDIQVTDPDRAYAIEDLNRFIYQYQQGGMQGAQNTFTPQQPSSVQTATPSVTPQPQGGGFRALQSFIGE